MNKNCDIVRDLMPLYLDQVCSAESGRIVREHLAECPKCAEIYSQMQDNEIEEKFEDEKEGVLTRQARFFKRRSAKIGAIIAGIFMIPILACLIVNLATGNGLGWFFVVFCAMLVAASVSVVPLMVPENKGLWTLASLVGSLLLLLGVTCLYTHGAWFPVAASAILFGFAVAFLPAVIRTKPVKALPIPIKGFWVMLIDTALFILLLACVAAYPGSNPNFFALAMSVAAPFMAFAWIIFLIAYFPKWPRMVKAGVSVALLGVMAFFTEFIVNRTLGVGDASSLPAFVPNTWDYATIDGNVKWTILIGCLIAGAVLIVIGIVRAKRSRS